MHISAEIRWFWPGVPTASFETWFCSKGAYPYRAGGGKKVREDWYLLQPDQAELGIKKRGGKSEIEIKGLVANWPAGPGGGVFNAPVELWTKWDSSSLNVDSGRTLLVKKLRWLRKYDTSILREIELGPDEKPVHEKLPESGCNVELTRIEVASATCWSFGFEAFGALDSVRHGLDAVCATLAALNPPSLGSAELMSYPRWLNHIAMRMS